MSSDSLWDVQTGVFTVLTGTSALTALLANGAASILDHVPTGTAFPYVVLGAAQSVPMDTQGVSGNEVTLTIDTYSRATGMNEARHIMSQIYGALHNTSFAVPNQVLVQCQCLDSATGLEADGMGRYAQDAVVRHGAQRFRIITEPA
jgi:hypothetical protein